MSIDVAHVFRKVLDGKWVGVGAIKRGGTYLGPHSCWLALPALVFVLPGPRQPPSAPAGPPSSPSLCVCPPQPSVVLAGHHLFMSAPGRSCSRCRNFTPHLSSTPPSMLVHAFVHAFVRAGPRYLVMLVGPSFGLRSHSFCARWFVWPLFGFVHARS